MKLHEYQAKEIIKGYGVPIQNGVAVESVAAAHEAALSLYDDPKGKWWVVKAQIHAGGRGKGGGVKLAKSLDQVAEVADSILGMTLVTHQTGPEGTTMSIILPLA